MRFSVNELLGTVRYGRIFRFHDGYRAVWVIFGIRVPKRLIKTTVQRSRVTCYIAGNISSDNEIIRHEFSA